MLFSKKSLEKEDWKNSGDGVLLLVLLSFFASSGTVLKNAFTKKKKKMEKIVVTEYFSRKSCRFLEFFDQNAYLSSLQLSRTAAFRISL